MADNHAEQQARAQVASIVEMVAALSVDYDRLEELRDKAKPGHYVAGWNMAGYMPDSEPAEFDDADDARGYLAERMREDAEALEDGTDPECLSDANMAGDTSKTDAAAHDLRGVADCLDLGSLEREQAEWGQTIHGTHYWITFGAGLSDPDEAAELAELEAAAGECTDEDEARERIQEDALSVEIRSDWCSPGETMTAGEFRLVLCTGGPHVEIVGDLDEHAEPSRPRILYRGWGSSGELFGFDRDAVLAYCRCHYFGA